METYFSAKNKALMKTKTSISHKSKQWRKTIVITSAFLTQKNEKH